MAAPDINPFVSVVITDGTTTLNLVDNTNYCLVDNSWEPAMAPMRKATLGNQGIFDDVVEDFEVYCMGATVIAVRANVEALANMMNQAAKYWRGDNDVAPVSFGFQTKNGTSIVGNSVYALIIGPVGNALEHTGNYGPLAIAKRARVRLRFTRRGALQGGDQFWTSSGVVSPGEISFGYSSGQYWRSKLSITGFGGTAFGTPPVLPQGYMIISDTHSSAIEAESGFSGTYHTAPVTVATTGASGGNVLRVYNDQVAWYSVPAAVLAAGQRYAVFALMRRGEVDSNPWTVRIGAMPSLYAGTNDIQSSDYVANTIIPPTTTNAWYALGSFTNNGSNKFLINYQTNDLTYTAQTMLIDMFVFVAIDRPGTNIVLIEKQTFANADATYTIIVDPGTFLRAPSITFTDGTVSAAAKWRGNLISESKGPLFWRYLACNYNGASGVTFGTTAVTFTVAATQNQLYLGPR